MNILPFHHHRQALALSLAACLPGLVVAADAVLPTIEVSGQRTRLDLEPDSLRNPYRSEATARFGTEVMTREDIEALAPKDVIDLLDKAVGMNIGYQGRRSPFFLDERGGGNLTYVLDGAVLPTSANRILQKIPLAAIEQVEVVRGATTLALGPTIPIGATASSSGINTGFVLIRTRRPRAAAVELAAFVEKADAQPTANGQSLLAGWRSDAAAPVASYLGLVAARSDFPSQDSWFDGRDAEVGLATGGIDLGRFSASLLAYEDSGRFEMQRGVTVSGALDSSRWWYEPLKTRVLSSEMTMAWSEDQVTLLSLFGTKYEQTEYNESFSSAATLPMRHFEEKTGGFGLRHNARFGDTLLQGGVQQIRSEGSGPNTNTPFNDWDTRVLGWSAGIEQKLLDGRLVLDGGYRRDLKHIDHSATSAAKLAANRDTDMAPARSFTLGAGWRFGRDYVLSGRYFDGHEGTAGDFDIRTQSGGPLHPADQKRKEIALEASPFPFFRPTLTWFDVAIRNQKTATSNTYLVAGQTYYYYTEADARRRGLELLVKGDLGPRTAYSVSWTHMTTNETTSAGVITDALDVSAPRNLYTARVSHGWGDWRGNVSYKRVGGWQQSTSPLGVVTNMDLGNYSRLDANIARDLRLWGHRLTLEFYGRNLGNDHYATRYTTGYYYDRGRTLGVQVAAKL